MKFFKELSFLLLVILNFQVVKAQNGGFQNSCGTKPLSREWETEFQKLVTQFTTNKTQNKTQQVYTIPVIVHVIHSGEPVGVFPNVSQNTVNDQIVVLNNDFAGSGYYSANYPANAFAAWAATANVSPASLDNTGRVAIVNSNIQFCLATQDTNGNILPEPGIQRYNYNAMGWPNPFSPSYNTLSTFSALYDTIIKPQTIWDPTKYLNIWVGLNNVSTGLGGYAYYPSLSTLSGYVPAYEIATPTNDGIYCSTFGFGYLGHIVTHEAGHWLGLIHTWGDSLCGNDYCNDTPTAPAPSFGSPIYPYNVNACAGSGNGVMFMNYMDYANNNAQYMFTTDQANRMQTALTNSPYRKYLGTHNLCSTENMATTSWFSAPNTICLSKTIQLGNQALGWPAPASFTWSASGGTFTPGPQAMSPSLQFSATGVYTISLAASNGTISVTTKTITITSPTLYFSSISQTICEGAVANFTVDGVSSFTWQPGNVMNSVVSFTPAASQTYTCEGMEVNDCGASGLVEVIVDACVGLDTYTGNELKLFLYPNPANGIVNLQINFASTPALTIQIRDAVGRIIHHDNIKITSHEQIFPVDVSSFDSGIYFIKVQTMDGFVKTEKFVKKGF